MCMDQALKSHFVLGFLITIGTKCVGHVNANVGGCAEHKSLVEKNE